MEAAARSVLGPVPIGKVLIQTNPETHNPELHYLKLPRAIAKDTSVLIMDATIASGVCALMAIRVLLVSCRDFALRIPVNFCEPSLIAHAPLPRALVAAGSRGA